MPARNDSELADLIARLPPSLAALAARGTELRYDKGRTLIHEGDVGDTLYIILKGRLRVFSVSTRDEREITYGDYGPGEYVGEMGLDGGPRSANVVASTRGVSMLIVRAGLEAHIAAHPGFAFELLAKVIARARAATFTARQLALNDVYGRIKLRFESAAVAQPDGTVRVERMTHKEMAALVGCGREMVSRVLKDLETGGYVTLHDDHWLLERPLPARW